MGFEWVWGILDANWNWIVYAGCVRSGKIIYSGYYYWLNCLNDLATL